MRPVFRPHPVLTLASLLALAILIGLGTWQLERLAWKEGLIAAITARIDLEPLPLESVLAMAPEDRDYRPVEVEGVFAHDREIYLFGQDAEGRVGFEVVTPLARPDGSSLLISRGFVPEGLRDPARRPEGQIEGPLRLTGLYRTGVRSGAFTPPPDPAGRVVYARDVDAMAALAAVPGLVPILIDATGPPPPGGWPRPGATRLAFTNRHLEYALTWYALAATLIGVYIALHAQTGRLGLTRS